MRIPDATSVGVRNPSSVGPISPTSSGSQALASSVENLSQTVGDIADSQYKRQANLALATADSQTIKGLLDLQDKIKSTDNYNDWQKEFDAQAPAVTAAVRGNLMGPETQGIYDASVQDHLLKFSTQMDDAATARREDVQRGGLAQLLQDNRDIYNRTTDPKIRENILNSTNEAITAASAPAAGRGPLITPETSVKTKRDFTIGLSEDHYASLDPVQAMKELSARLPGRLRGDGAQGGQTPNFDTTNAPGMVTPGNLDPWNRPVLHNADGSYSTTSSMSIGTDKGEVLIPTVIDGKRLSKQEAIAHFNSTGENLGTFKTPEDADKYATALHNAQATMFDAHGNPASGSVAATNLAHNNLGNLRTPDGKGWQTFQTQQEGIDAVGAQIKRDINVHGLKTITALISDKTWGYAPASDHNDTQSYIASVANQTKIDPNAPITSADIPKIRDAMIRVEQGGTPSARPNASYQARAISSETDSASVKTGTPADFLPDSEVIRFYHAAASELKQQQTEAKRGIAAQQAQNEFELGVQIDNGKVSPDQVIAYERQGAIAPGKALEFYSKAQTAYGANDMVLSSLTTGIPLDPGNSKARNSVDHYWDKQIAPSLAGQPPEQQAAATALFVEKTGIMPQGAVGKIRSAFRAGNVDQRVNAANMLDAVANTTPNALGSFDVTEIAQARSVAKMVREGVPPPEAVQYADQDGRMDKTLKDARQGQLEVKTGNVKMVDQALAKVSANLSGAGWLSSGAKIPDVAQSEFRDLFTEAYLRTGDVDSSVKATTDAATRTWGVSQINGDKSLMKYAPEKLYGVIDQGPKDSEWQRFQLVRDVTKNGAFDAALGPVEDRIQIGPDSRTARDGSYVVLLKNKDGAFEPIIGKNQAPVRWRPDVQGERDYLLQQKQQDAAKSVQSARDLRRDLTAMGSVSGESQ